MEELKMKSQLRVVKSSVLIALIVLVLAGCGSSAATSPASTAEVKTQDKVVTLKLADTFPTTHLMNKVTVDVFIKEMEKSGKIKIEYFPAGQIGKPEDMLEMVKGGAVDIAYVSPGFIAGSLPTSSVVSLPNEFESPMDGSLVLYDLANGILSSEFDKQGVKPVFVSLTLFYEIFTTSKQVKLPKDVNGLKVRGGGGEADATLKILGTSVVSMPSNDVYEGMQKKVIDWASISFASGQAYRIHEIAKYSTEGANLGSLATIHFINKAKFDSLSPEVQQIIKDAGKKATVAAAEAWVKSDVEAKQVFTKQGGSIYTLSNLEKQMWNDATKEASSTWVKSLNNKGINSAQHVYDEMQKIKKNLKKQ
jgi:TRAP-type C4-dicarboxylate transport system substrate-binding protein